MTPNASVASLLEQGHDQLDKGDYAAALETFHQAATLEPQNPQVLYGLGLACYRLERYQDSVESLNQALEIQPNYILALAQRGLAYQKLKQPQQAQVDFEQAIVFAPEDADGWYGRGIALDGLQRYEEAIASFDKAIEIKPHFHLAWFNRGYALGNLGRNEEAVASFDKAIEIKPNDHLAWNSRGIVLCDFLRRYEEALASFDKAIEIKPDYDSAWLNRGNALGNLGRHSEAVASYNKAIEIKPDNDWAWYNRGYALYNLGRHSEAVASFDKAIEIKPDKHSAWFNRGIALDELGRHSEAVASYNKAIEFKPDDDSAWFNRGNALENLGRYSEAVASYDKAIEIKPDKHSAWNSRGGTLYNLGRYSEAVASFDKAIEIKPDDDSAWFNRGYALFNLGRYSEAVASYDKAIEIKPDDDSAWKNRGYALGYLGRYEDVIASFDKAIEIKPDNDSAWNNQGYALGYLGRYEDAIAFFDKAIEIKPDNDSAWNNRGGALYKLGQYEQAVASFDKAIEIKPDYHETWNSRGGALYDLGRHEDAIASFDKAIKFKPDSDWAWDNRGKALYNLGRYEEAVASFDEALRLTDYQDWLAWENRGIALLKSQGYKAAVKSWDDGIKALKPETPDYEEGCGKLHRRKGKILYEYAKDEPNPFPHCFDAKESYEQALNFLSFEKFRQRHLQVLEEFLKVCSALGDNQTFARRLEEGTQRLEQLVRECESKGEEITLARKFAAFDQLRVDIRLQSNQFNKEIAALELAEKRKNTCLAWLREGWDYQPPQFNYQDMQKLLNPKTAAIYWHISPVAITTFIIKHNQPPKLLQPQLPRELQQQHYPTNLHQLKRFEGWMQKWKQGYQDYCQGNYTSAAKETAPWRQDMEDMLLNELRDVLEIHRLRDYLKDVDHLILIPHRELHLLPLDYLFPERFTITYLPSFQIGLKLLAQPFNQPLGDDPTNIVNVGNSDLPFDNIESAALASLYPGCRQLQIPPVKQKALIDALRENTGYFHFAGHGDHIPEQPRESFLMLAEYEKLTLGDIVDDDELDLSQYQLICLSACETGITSQESLVDEYVGLVSGFLAKGANYVVSTLWRVDERSTAILMIKFYQLLKQKESPAAALKQAKDWLRQLTYEGLAKWYCDLAKDLDEPLCREYLETEAQIIENDRDRMTSTKPVYAHPYYWAGFILTGKPV